MKATETQLDFHVMKIAGLTSYMMHSKMADVDAVNLNELYTKFGENLYHRGYYIEMEGEIMDYLQYDTSSTNSYDFVVYYFKLIKYLLQASSQVTSTMHSYLNYSEKLAQYFCRMTLVDHDIQNLSASSVGAAAVSFGLFSAENIVNSRLVQDPRYPYINPYDPLIPKSLWLFI